MTWVQTVLRAKFSSRNFRRKHQFCYSSTCIVFIGCFREEEESEEDEEMENQENGDTDAKKTVEGTTQDYPMARCVSLYTCLSTTYLCNAVFY